MTPDQRCATCRWWRHDPGTVFLAGDSRARTGECALADSEHYGDPEHAQRLAVAQGDDAEWCWLKTAPDFGCVQWAVRETASE